jgi:hypothetical protein
MSGVMGLEWHIHPLPTTPVSQYGEFFNRKETFSRKA